LIYSSLNGLGHEHDRGFIQRSISHAPNAFIKHILSDYKKRFEIDGRRSANLSLLKLSDKLKGASFSLASSDDEIRQKADKNAKACGEVIARAGVYAGMEYAQFMGVALPDVDLLDNQAGMVGRLSCSSWWRRALRKKHGRTVEAVALDLNIVNKHKEIYASNASLNRRASQKSRNRAMLEECLAINELDQEYTLQELADLSVSNPKIRRGELMLRIRGFEEYAKSLGMVGLFMTFTCPSRFHSAHSKTGARNKKYDGLTPRDGQKYLAKVWARIRAKLKRESLEIFGLRVCEPQQDGTPHWHLLLFAYPERVNELKEVCRHYNLQDSGKERGAQKYRFDCKMINWKRGSAAGYIAKYIAKNIDGFAVERDLFGNDAVAAAARVDAWASTWGIRQFQQIGGPPVTVWRELRRLKNEDIADAPEHLRALHSAADTAHWQRFCELMSEQRAGLHKEQPFNPETGEIKLNRYLETAQPKIKGIEFEGRAIVTRVHEWSITVTAKRGGDLLSEAIAQPWSAVNNCTQGGKNGREFEQSEQHNRKKGVCRFRREPDQVAALH